jgi:nucleoside-diphosphate-sugar epimerase
MPDQIPPRDQASRRCLLILGCGFVGTEAARQALAAGQRVIGTTRDPVRLSELRAQGIDAHLTPALNGQTVGALAPPDAAVLVTFAPDGFSDLAIAPSLSPRRVVYLSTTGVYGNARGRVDERTATDANSPRAAVRLAAEALYQREGGLLLRAAGIYGPGRGLHRRLLDRSFRLPGEGTNVVSRVHVSDLASIALSALSADASTWTQLSGRAFPVADDTPVPQIEAIRWLVARLGLEMPASASIDEVSPTLRHDRAVDNSAIKRALGIELRYPSYRQGFAACIAEENAQSTRF